MSSTKKTWAEIASKTTKSSTKAPRQSTVINPQPILYHPLIPALARSDIPCSRCKHKNHLNILDDLPEDHPRPGCPECKVCFPEKMGGTAVGAPVKSPPKRAPRATSTPKSSPQMSAIQFGTFSTDESSQLDDVELGTIEPTPPQSPKRAASYPDPNRLFFEKDDEEEASYAQLLKGSGPDDTPAHKRWSGPAIRSERGKGTF
jgi:hypothetical protein